MIYFIVILIAVIVAIFFIPVKLVIYTNIKGKNVYYVENLKSKNEFAVEIKIFGIITIYKYNSLKNKKEDELKNTRLSLKNILTAFKKSVGRENISTVDLTSKFLKWCRKLKFSKFVLVGGFNTEDYVKNAYINASINSIICMIINGNQKNFDFNKLYYQVSISNYNYYIALDSIISFSFVHNIDIFITIIRFIKNLKKEKIKKMRRDEYGRTSDRKLNDNSNEFA